MTIFIGWEYLKKLTEIDKTVQKLVMKNCYYIFVP
jgi:hypothetical protein